MAIFKHPPKTPKFGSAPFHNIYFAAKYFSSVIANDNGLYPSKFISFIFNHIYFFCFKINNNQNLLTDLNL